MHVVQLVALLGSSTADLQFHNRSLTDTLLGASNISSFPGCLEGSENWASNDTPITEVITTFIDAAANMQVLALFLRARCA